VYAKARLPPNGVDIGTVAVYVGAHYAQHGVCAEGVQAVYSATGIKLESARQAESRARRRPLTMLMSSFSTTEGG